ncbi:formate dehydrogenase accessory protein FdhE domain-containing protein [Candidatus Korarchaeum cryptofilum]|uniref:Uncharacterized protein involved in formate dehydrogenase formation n=1 Tax=Korarchaeum cryptofilum (strain OPF8) TaxID=374847 RepID=B1L5Z2_KORCO|nr:formate dehydrogenase accessory protein FdhE [Candidatus Korarchaeum cryptofilum]ACB07871.1 Uncharacterized protein involved in formate dehydrogenase formation [Candidatus Korarchaeum cryptofilum OPF8]
MDIDRIRESAEKIVEKDPEISDSIHLFLDILAVQLEIMDEIIGKIDPEELIADRYPLFDAIGIPKVEPELWTRCMDEIISRVSSHREDLREELDAVRESLHENLFDPEALAILSFKGDMNYARGVSVSIGVSEDLLSALGIWTIQPIFMAIRELSKEIKGWNAGFCPICGSYTRTSFLKGDKVFMKCEICGEEWEYPSNTCPFCGSKKIEPLELKGETSQIMRCDECGAHWNLINEDLLGDISREIYPMLTLKLESMLDEGI